LHIPAYDYNDVDLDPNADYPYVKVNYKGKCENICSRTDPDQTDLKGIREVDMLSGNLSKVSVEMGSDTGAPTKDGWK
jgi:hypothetical protein